MENQEKQKNKDEKQINQIPVDLDELMKLGAAEKSAEENEKLK